MALPMTLTEAPIMKWSLGTKEGDDYLHRRDLAPGSFNNIRTLGDGSIILTFTCPCGCGAVTFVQIEHDANAGRHVWEWNGDSRKPTLSPSLQTHATCKWHGFIKEGEFINA